MENMPITRLIPSPHLFIRSAGEGLHQPHFLSIQYLSRTSSFVEQSGAVEACWAHNPEVRRSKLRSAKILAPESFHLLSNSKFFPWPMSCQDGRVV